MNKDKRKELKVSAIENGTVIDHIPAEAVFQVINILGLSDSDSMLILGTNLDSKKLGKKGVIKISNKYFESDELNKIALVAPNATLIVIKDFTVVYKEKAMIPERITKIVKCINPNCITNHEKITSMFSMIEQEPLKLQCHYCEKSVKKENITFQ